MAGSAGLLRVSAPMALFPIRGDGSGGNHSRPYGDGLAQALDLLPSGAGMDYTIVSSDRSTKTGKTEKDTTDQPQGTGR